MTFGTDGAGVRPRYEMDRRDTREYGPLEPAHSFCLSNWENEGGALPPSEPLLADRTAMAT